MQSSAEPHMKKMSEQKIKAEAKIAQTAARISAEREKLDTIYCKNDKTKWTRIEKRNESVVKWNGSHNHAEILLFAIFKQIGLLFNVRE